MNICSQDRETATGRFRLAAVLTLATVLAGVALAAGPAQATKEDGGGKTKPDLSSLLKDASRHESEGNLAEAIAAQHAAWRLRPKDTGISNKLLSLYDRVDEPANKIPIYLARLEEHPGDVRIMTTIGTTCFQAGDRARADEYWGLALAKGRESEDTYNRLRAAYSRCGLRDEAIGALQKGCDALPGNRKLHSELGRALERAGRYPEAIAALERSLVLPDNSSHHRMVSEGFILGSIFRRTNKMDEGLRRHTERMDALRRELGRAYWELARVLIVNGKRGEALHQECLAKVTGVLRPMPYPHMVGKGAPDSRDAETAEDEEARVRKDVARRKPVFLQGLRVLSFFAKSVGDFDMFLEAIGEIAQHLPRNIDIQLELVSEQLDCGYADFARATLRSILDVDPEELRALHQLAILAADAGDTAEAAKWRSRVASAKKDDEKAHVAAASYLKRRLLPDHALSEYERVLAMPPHDSTSDEAALKYLAGRAAATNDYARAVELQERALACRAKRNPRSKSEDGSRQATFYCAMDLINRGRESEAMPLFEKMIEQCSPSTWGARRLGERFSRMGMHRLAVRAYERACGLPSSPKAKRLSKNEYEAMRRRIEAAQLLARYEKPQRKMPEQEAREFMAGFGTVRWIREDLHEPARWVALEGRFVWMDDYGSSCIEPFPDLQASRQRPLNASAIAFSPARVWVATDAGLLCFNRAARTWTQRIIAGLAADAAVDEVQYADGKLSIAAGGTVFVLDAE